MTLRCLTYEEFSVCRRSLNYIRSKIDDITMSRLYEEFYLASVYNDVNYDELFAILDAAEKTKLLQEALDI